MSQLREHHILAERMELEGEYVRMRKETAYIGRRLNVLTLPSCLPPELLAEVFAQHDPWQFDPGDHDGLDYSDNTEILTVSQVSHHWRQVAIASPRLWCHIRLHKRPAYNLMLLERSKDAPLYIEGFPRDYEMHDLLPVLRALPRACYLHMIMKPQASLDLLRSVWPELGKGSILVPGLRTYLEMFNFDYSLQEWPSVLSSLITPALRTAVVVPSRAVLLHLRSRSLVNLTIFLPFLYTGDSFSTELAGILEDTAELLLTLPSLETLEVRLPRRFEPLPDSTTQIPLPALRTLQLHGDLLPVESLIRRMVFPTTVRVNGSLSNFAHAHAPDYPGLTDAVLNVLQHFVAGNGESGTLAGLDFTEGMRMGCWFGVEGHPDAQSQGKPCPDDSDNYFSFHISPMWTIASMAFGYRPSLFAVRYLHISYIPTIMDGYQTLRQLTTVEELKFVGIFVLRVVDLLCPDGDDQTPPFAMLRVLRLDMCSRGVAGEGHAEDHAGEDPIPLGHDGCKLCETPATLISALQQRRAAGIHLRSLIVRDFENEWLIGRDVQADIQAVADVVSAEILVPPADPFLVTVPA